jgi:hypothetical protein
MKATEIIKTPSFEAIDNISGLIHNSLKGSVELEIIKNNVSKVLLRLGSSNFVALYNMAIASKNYTAFIENLNITKK